MKLEPMNPEPPVTSMSFISDPSRTGQLRPSSVASLPRWWRQAGNCPARKRQAAQPAGRTHCFLPEQEHRPILYNQMLLSEKLYPHLIEIDETAQSRLEQMMPQLAKEAGATEELKASDPMKWVGLMNTCKAQAEEILMAEFINS